MHGAYTTLKRRGFYNVAINVLVFITAMFYAMFENSENYGLCAVSRIELLISGILLPPQCSSSSEVWQREHLAAGKRAPLKTNCICIFVASFEGKCSIFKVRLKYLNEIGFDQLNFC